MLPLFRFILTISTNRPALHLYISQDAVKTVHLRITRTSSSTCTASILHHITAIIHFKDWIISSPFRLVDELSAVLVYQASSVPYSYF